MSPLARVFLVDVLACPHCGRRPEVLAATHDPVSIRSTDRLRG
jgi:hypothetical protein